ncbi:hypothetical protein [Glycomyces harbinensis]|uniref:Uncharacterized protein n=1 Tax=Glycomyces harbinensis TaxID=58114 RepID=A0A1G7BJW8_9ACTN|nr:hypothetical protein [Glycomyces harbinensis]SDE27349.1 hypothetical protein SAMN05216270_1174 [Glycomyces harbinensis]
MTTTVALLEITVSARPERKLSFSVELDDSSATVRYRAKLWTSEADVVLMMAHREGRICQVNWSEYWRQLWAPNIRIELVGRVQQMLIKQLRETNPEP